jgi:hypothetical protein
MITRIRPVCVTLGVLNVPVTTAIVVDTLPLVSIPLLTAHFFFFFLLSSAGRG